MDIVKEKIKKMKAGQKVITNDKEMDTMSEIDGDFMNCVRSITNPDRCGILDQYVAWGGF